MGQAIEIVTPQALLEVVVPPGLERVEADEPATWVFQGNGLEAEVRYYPGPRSLLGFTLRHRGTVAVTVPGFRLAIPSAAYDWLAGSVGRFILPDGAWVMTSGWCADADGMAAVFGATVPLGPRQTVWSCWRFYRTPEVPPMPAWVPSQRYQPVGDPVLIPDLDVAVTGTELSVETVTDGSLVRGPVGLHQLLVYGPVGTSSLTIGWYHPLSKLVSSAMECAEDRADLWAWLATWLLTQPDGMALQLDRLDTALGQCFEQPTFWGVLAGLYAARVTELPVVDEATAAAREYLMRFPEEFPYVAAQAALLGIQDIAFPMLAPLIDAAGGNVLAPNDDDALARLSARLGYGQPQTRPRYTAKDVAGAYLWLATRAESLAHLDFTSVAATAQHHLMSQASRDPDPVTVAWLLVGWTLDTWR